jgi:hypothetical protein
MAKGVSVTDGGVDKLADFDVIPAAPVTGSEYSKSLRRTR